MARRGKGRSINGIVLLDKPTDISSNHALQRVKRLFFANKAGHTGALDPLATGMLPVCLGEATKFSQFLLDSDKRYTVTATLGIRTDTSDSQGDVVSEKPVSVTQAQLDKAVDTFRGDIMQIPSMYSALKFEGKPLYKYAREGITIDRPARPISVYEINQLRFEGNEVDLDIHVSKGTYIRTIVDDLGELLGCGAHVSMLRRTQVADYPYERMVTIEQLDELIEQAQRTDIAHTNYSIHYYLIWILRLKNTPKLISLKKWGIMFCTDNPFKCLVRQIIRLFVLPWVTPIPLLVLVK